MLGYFCQNFRSKMTDFPFNFEDIDWVFGNSPMMKVLPDGYYFATSYKEYLPKIYNMKVRPDDIWQIGLPKSGTTWVTELIWGVYYEADLTEAKSKYSFDRWMCLDIPGGFKASLHGLDTKTCEDIKSKSADYFTSDIIDKAINAKSPRFIRTHIPLSLLPPKLLDTGKVVYVARNFKDAWVSLYKMVEGGTFERKILIEETFEEFLEDRSIFSPHHKHLKEAYNKKNHKNMFFLLYEDMKKDLPGVIRRLASFLNKTLTEDQVDILVDHLSIQSMRKNEFVNCEDMKPVGFLGENQQFIRKGVVGDWRNHFTPTLLENYNAWWDKHMSDCDFTFPED